MLRSIVNIHICVECFPLPVIYYRIFIWDKRISQCTYNISRALPLSTVRFHIILVHQAGVESTWSACVLWAIKLLIRRRQLVRRCVRISLYPYILCAPCIVCLPFAHFIPTRLFRQTRAWGDRHKCRHANWHPHWQRTLRRPWPTQVAIWCLERRRYIGQPHGERRCRWVSVCVSVCVYTLEKMFTSIYKF